MAHRRDSLPRDGASLSLIIPTTNGPKPRPIRFNTKNKIAEVSDRIDAGTRLCATAIDGPRYMLCREAQQPKQISEKDVLLNKQSSGRKENGENNCISRKFQVPPFIFFSKMIGQESTGERTNCTTDAEDRT